MTASTSQDLDSGQHILPYSAVVGQEDLKLALELSFVMPRLGGCLLTGDRGTAKSTTVRAFARMMFDRLPVTLPINATEDRVVGGWRIHSLMEGKAEEQPGLLEEADGTLLYIDEVNLLDDHLVNIILDVTSTGVLEIHREGRSDRKRVRFSLVGTMNPEEGGLRPQLLDRFGLLVHVRTEPENRAAILKSVLDHDQALETPDRVASEEYFDNLWARDFERRELLLDARGRLPKLTDAFLSRCVDAVGRLDTDGHRGERVLALAAQAYGAIRGDEVLGVEHLRRVAPFALQHRLRGAPEPHPDLWTESHQEVFDEIEV